MAKLIRITTVPLSLEKLLEGQLSFMSQYYEVIAVSSDEARLEAYGKQNEVKVFHVEMTREITPYKDLRALWKLFNYFRKEKPEIVHTHTPKAGILGMLAAKLAGIPLRLHTVAGLPLLEVKGLRRTLLEVVEKITYLCATRVIPNSVGLREIILQKKFTDKKKIVMVGNGSSNGIDTEYFNPEEISSAIKEDTISSLGIAHEDFVFIFVGRIVADKGINELVQAFVKLQKNNARVSLLLVGPFEQELDPVRSENFELIHHHPKIYSTGFRNDVRPFFAISDALVFPSYREGFPNVVMQAGAMGLPSIVSDINGCNEIIQDGKNGLIIPPKDEKALFEAMANLMEDQKRRELVGKECRSIICKKYERKAFWSLLLREYKKLETQYLK